MNVFEHLEEEACKDGIEVIRYDFKSDRIEGMCCGNTVAINTSINTTIKKADILAEEMGHYFTTVGDILDQSDTQNRKQERQARIWAYNKRIGLRGLIRAYEHGCKSRYETAEFLEVTEESLEDAVRCYREKYGVSTNVDNYTIYFIPQLAVFKKI